MPEASQRGMWMAWATSGRDEQHGDRHPEGGDGERPRGVAAGKALARQLSDERADHAPEERR
jgi:hypothetical protein